MVPPTPKRMRRPKRKRKQQQTLHLAPMVCSSYKEGSVTHLLYILLKYMFLNLPHNAICSTAHFKLRARTSLRFDTATWNQSNPPTCNLWDADDIQDKQHVLFHCVNPHVFLSAKQMHLCSPKQELTMCLFLSQNNNKKLSFSIHELDVFYKQASTS